MCSIPSLNQVSVAPSGRLSIVICGAPPVTSSSCELPSSRRIATTIWVRRSCIFSKAITPWSPASPHSRRAPMRWHWAGKTTSTPAGDPALSTGAVHTKSKPPGVVSTSASTPGLKSCAAARRGAASHASAASAAAASRTSARRRLTRARIERGGSWLGDDLPPRPQPRYRLGERLVAPRRGPVVANLGLDRSEVGALRRRVPIDADEVEAEARSPLCPRRLGLLAQARDELVAEAAREIFDLAPTIATTAAEGIAEA